MEVGVGALDSGLGAEVGVDAPLDALADLADCRSGFVGELAAVLLTALPVAATGPIFRGASPAILEDMIAWTVGFLAHPLPNISTIVRRGRTTLFSGAIVFAFSFSRSSPQLDWR